MSSRKLARETGAIAYDSKQLAAGRKSGITVELRDQWRRATAQAAIGVNAVRTLRVRGSVGYRHGGSTATFRVAGLAPRERWTVRLGDAATRHGAASARGVAYAKLTLPSGTRSYDLRAYGSRSARTGRATVRALGRATFRAELARTRVRHGRTQRIRVTGLAAHEWTRIVYQGHRIWNGRATPAGKVVHSFEVGFCKQEVRVVVRGAFDDRSVSRRFTVR